MTLFGNISKKEYNMEDEISRHTLYKELCKLSYNDKKMQNEFDVVGQCLHAQKLEFKHPITQKDMCLEAELPQYFKDILDKLKDREIK